MSFIYPDVNGQVYAPGYFLAHEDCVRETREFSKTSALVQTAADGSKYVPMGTAYPTNDGSAIGIAYEDVDVTSGNMPGSVVTSGVVYENRLAKTGDSYSTVTLKDLVSPKAQGWYQSDGSSGYELSIDTTVDTSKTYYEDSAGTTAVSDYAAVLNPKAEGWYESDGQSPATYTLSTDTAGVKTKTYYKQSDVRLASAAKTALAALGFTFISSEPAVVRPY